MLILVRVSFKALNENLWERKCTKRSILSLYFCVKQHSRLKNMFLCSVFYEAKLSCKAKISYYLIT